MAKRKRPDAEGSRQYAAIPIRLRKNGKAEVLLLTSRGKGRWGIPKGWPMRKRSPKGTARREAFEEAGLKGRVIRHGSIGRYRYTKTGLGKIRVKVFVMQVERQVREWPEKPERKTRWFTPDQAAARISDRRLGRMLRKAAKLASAAA
jgi:8-oxo-dGTP pyrophosphatase MutT (NUDIX family)